MRILVLILLSTLTAVIGCQSGETGQEPGIPFGGEDDVAFARALWAAMEGYDEWRLTTDVYPGQSPHGKFLRMYYNMVNVNGTSYHVIVKDNYGSMDATLEDVVKDPLGHLMAVTVMVQREAGYDPDNNDWFWVKYMADGTVDKNDKGMAMAGRVAKGMEMGCIACHKAMAQGGDYLIFNDP
jgi:hypothetical protein